MEGFFFAIILTAILPQPLTSHELAAEVDSSMGPTSNLTCHYKGREYLSGETIHIEEPCLSCTCKGALVCSLRVCPMLPNPPPPGCVIVHKNHQCCPQIICDDLVRLDLPTTNFPAPKDNLNGCGLNGSIYSEGSALPSSTLCEFCYCMHGQQRCISPHCQKPAEHCTPSHTPYSCCPVHYNCSRSEERVRKIDDLHNSGCTVNGKRYSEGDMVDSSNACSTCYCIENQVKCQPVTCTIQHVEGCYPVYLHDRCCPVAYNCSSLEETPKTISHERSLHLQNSATNLQNTKEPIESTTQPDTTTVLQTSTELDNSIATELDNFTATTEIDTVTEMTTDEIGITTTWFDERFAQTSSSNDSTTEYLESTTATMTTTEVPNIITLPPRSSNVVTTNLRMDDPENVPLPVENFLLNSTNDEYGSYDYSDANLPPSLPNLVIFPFVAADAVTKEKEKETEAEKKIDNVPEYYAPFFSQPVETEGGFVPKEDPLPDSVTFQPIYFDDKIPIIAEAVEPVDQSTSITMPPKPHTEICVSEGREYADREELPQIVECITCICLSGNIMCEETPCPIPPPGCSKSLEKKENSCCPAIICEPLVTTPSSIDFTSQTLNTTGFTLEPIITTDRPDAIRTEPAPDLPSLMGEIMPFLMDQQTKKPVTVNYANKIVNYYPKHQITSTKENSKTTLVFEDHVAVVSSTEAYDFDSMDTSASPIYRHTTVVSDFPSTESSYEGTTQGSREISLSPSKENISSEVTTEEVMAVVNVAKEREDIIEKPAELEKIVTTVGPEAEKKTTPLLGIKSKVAKNVTTTTESESFLDGFLKGFFELEDEGKSTTQAPPSKMHHINSSQIRSPPVLPTTTMPSVEIIQQKEGAETETGSFSLDSVLDMLFKAEATDNPTPKIPKHKNSTKIRKPSRKTKKPVTTTTPLPITTEKIVTTTIPRPEAPETIVKPEFLPPKTSTPSESSFVTDENTGFPRINILNKLEKAKIPTKPVKGQVSKQPETLRKPTKVSGNIGGMLKLAGCNIYGRMYRVGKIIAELTNACLECKCTESGVQCTKVAC